MKKRKLLISFSGGKTSAYMTKLLLDKLKKDEWEIVVVFANTGWEHDETLKFVKKCDDNWNFKTIWVEAVVDPVRGQGTTHRKVTYETASRWGEPFMNVVIKYGLPNDIYQHCTRDLKINPIHSYVKNELGWVDYFTAIGIRADEEDRKNKNWKGEGFIYPLIRRGITVQFIEQYWIKQNFTLEIPRELGNCLFCFKKSDPNLIKACIACPEKAKQWILMGIKYRYYVHPDRKSKSTTPFMGPFYIYRQYRGLEWFAQKAEEIQKDKTIYCLVA